MLIAISALRNVVIAICDYDSIVILRWRVGTQSPISRNARPIILAFNGTWKGYVTFVLSLVAIRHCKQGCPQHRTNHQLACIADYQSSRQ